jgi:hypothetical protein
MNYIYVFPVEEFDRNIEDSALLTAYLNGKGIERYEQAEFINALNDENINIDTHWVKMIDDHDGLYPIAFLHADDLIHAGFDASNVMESDMLTLADKMNDDYLDWSFWDSLKIIADFIGIPRLNSAKS